MTVDSPYWKKKTRPCPFYSQGKCYFKDACNFIHVAKAQLPPEILITASRSIDGIDDSDSSNSDDDERIPTPPNPLSPDSVHESPQTETPKQRESWDSIHSIVSAATDVTYPTDRSPTNSIDSRSSPFPEDEENTLTVYGDLAYSIGTRIILDPPKPRRTLTLPTTDDGDHRTRVIPSPIREEHEEDEYPTRQLSLNSILLNLQDPSARPRREVFAPENPEDAPRVVQTRPPPFVGGDRSAPAFRLHLSSLIANRTSLIYGQPKKKMSSPNSLPSMNTTTELERDISPPRAASDPKKSLTSFRPSNTNKPLSPIPQSANSAAINEGYKHVFTPDGPDAFRRPFRPARGKDRGRAQTLPDEELPEPDHLYGPEIISPEGEEHEVTPSIAMPVPPSPTVPAPDPPPTPLHFDSPGLFPTTQTPPLRPRSRSKSPSPSPSQAPAVLPVTPPLRPLTHSKSPSPTSAITSNTPPLRLRSRSKSPSLVPPITPIEPLRLRSNSKSPSPSPEPTPAPALSLPSPKLALSSKLRSPSSPGTHERFTSRDLTESPEYFLPHDRRQTNVAERQDSEDELELLDKYLNNTPEKRPRSKDAEQEGEVTVRKRTNTPPKPLVEEPTPTKPPPTPILHDSPQHVFSPASDTDDSEVSATSASSKLRPLRLSMLFKSNPQTPLKNAFFDIVTAATSAATGPGSGAGDVRPSHRRPLSALLDDVVSEDEVRKWKGKGREVDPGGPDMDVTPGPPAFMTSGLNASNSGATKDMAAATKVAPSSPTKRLSYLRSQLSISPSKPSRPLMTDTPSNDTQPSHTQLPRGTTSQPRTPLLISAPGPASSAMEVKLGDGSYHSYYSNSSSPQGMLFRDRPKTIEEAATKMGGSAKMTGLGISISSPPLTNAPRKERPDGKRVSHRYSRSYPRQPTSNTLPSIEGSPTPVPLTAPLSSSATFSPPPPPPASISRGDHSRSSSVASNSTNTDRPLLFWALASDNMEEVERLLATGEATANDKAGPEDLPALVFAMENDTLKNRTEMVKMLLEYGADPTALASSSGGGGGGTSGEEGDEEDELNRRDSVSTVKAGQRPKKRMSTSRMGKQRADTMSSTTSDSTIKNVIGSNPAIEYYLTRKADIPKGQLEALRKAGFDPLTRMPFHMVGQDLVLSELLRVLARHSQQQNPSPVSVIFAGPSGHGKSLLSNNIGKLLRIPMHTVNMTNLRNQEELLTARSLTTNLDGGGSTLADFLALHEGQRCVVILEEIEKVADKSASNTLLMPWELGKLNTTTRVFDTSRVIWISTSNAGEDIVFDFLEKRIGDRPCQRQEFLDLATLVRRKLIESLGASLVSRITTVLPFLAFTREEKLAISYQAVPSNSMSKAETDELLEKVLEDYIPSEGVRSIQRAVQRRYEEDLW